MSFSSVDQEWSPELQISNSKLSALIATPHSLPGGHHGGTQYFEKERALKPENALFQWGSAIY